MEHALADTGFWYALFDHRDQHYREAGEIAELLDAVQIVIPWPSLYETLRTKLVRNTAQLQRFEHFLKSRHIVYLDDNHYRDAAFELALESSLRKGRPLSMVDCLIRLIIDDRNINIRYLFTYNRADFIDVCNKHRVELI